MQLESARKHCSPLITVDDVKADEPEKGLTAEEREHLAGILRRIVNGRFDGNATHAATAMGISQSQFSQILKGKRTERSAGIPVLKRIRRFTGLSIDALLNLPPLQALVPPSAEGAPPPSGNEFHDAVRAALRAALAEIQRERDTPTEPPAPPKRKIDAPRPRRR